MPRVCVGNVGLQNLNLLSFADAYGTVPEVARAYKAANLNWIIIGDENYGEGSAREHAAMQPRFLGCVAVICRSFARIHETNLKKQGVLPLAFATASDYDKVTTEATVDLLGFENPPLSAASKFKLRLRYSDGRFDTELPLIHTLSDDQIEWFKAGSALNYVAQQSSKKS